jgi:hypothetical protein
MSEMVRSAPCSEKYHVCYAPLLQRPAVYMYGALPVSTHINECLFQNLVEGRTCGNATTNPNNAAITGHSRARPLSPTFDTVYIPCSLDLFVPSLLSIMASRRGPYAGNKRRLVVSIDVGTTFTAASFAILQPEQDIKFEEVLRWPMQVSTLVAARARISRASRPTRTPKCPRCSCTTGRANPRCAVDCDIDRQALTCSVTGVRR